MIKLIALKPVVGQDRVSPKSVVATQVQLRFSRRQTGQNLANSVIDASDYLYAFSGIGRSYQDVRRLGAICFIAATHQSNFGCSLQWHDD